MQRRSRSIQRRSRKSSKKAEDHRPMRPSHGTTTIFRCRAHSPKIGNNPRLFIKASEAWRSSRLTRDSLRDFLRFSLAR